MKPGFIRTTCLLLLAAFAPLVPALAAPSPDPVADPTTAIVDKALAEIKDGNPQKAIDLVEPVIAANDQIIAKDKRRVYCGMSPTETLSYMVQSAAQKKDAIAMSPTVCDALFAKAFALVDLDRTNDAQIGFKRLVELAPDHSQYWSELANTYRLQKDWGASLSAYQKAEDSAALAVKDDKANRTCASLRGQGFALVELARWDEAERVYRKCLKAIPNEPRSLGELAYIAQHRPKK